MMNVTTSQGKSSLRKPLKSWDAACTPWIVLFFLLRTLNQRLLQGSAMPVATQQTVARSREVPAPLCPHPAASCAGQLLLPSKAKKQSPAQYFFPLPAIRPSLKDSLSCSCSYYIVFRSPAPKTRRCGPAKHPSGGDITCATTGASNPITASSRGTTGDAP